MPLKGFSSGLAGSDSGVTAFWSTVAAAGGVAGVGLTALDCRSGLVCPKVAATNRIGSVNDGKVLYRIPDPLELKGTSAAEGVAVDAKGNVYGAVVRRQMLERHVK